MTTPLIIWSLIAGTFALAMLAQLWHLAHDWNKRHPLILHISEREMLYMPGDPLHADNADADDIECIC